MSVLLVGGDRLGSMVKCLGGHGIEEICHLSGRKKSDMRKLRIPPTIAFVIVLVDYVNHMTAKHIKEQAKAQGVPVLFTRNSGCALEEKLLAQAKRKLTAVP